MRALPTASSPCCRAAQELAVGDTADLATDVGPVIDRRPHDNIQRHLQRLHAQAKALAAPSGQRGGDAAKTIAKIWRRPTPSRSAAFERRDLRPGAASGALGGATGRCGSPRSNALGYGLTLGIQTRIDSRAQALARAGPAWATCTSTAT